MFGQRFCVLSEHKHFFLIKQRRKMVIYLIKPRGKAKKIIYGLINMHGPQKSVARAYLRRPHQNKKVQRKTFYDASVFLLSCSITAASY